MLLIFYFTNYKYLFPIHEWEKDNQSTLNNYSIKIIYIIDKNFKIELVFGKDKVGFSNMKSFTTFFEKTFQLKNSIKLDNFLIIYSKLFSKNEYF